MNAMTANASAYHPSDTAVNVYAVLRPSTAPINDTAVTDNAMSASRPTHRHTTFAAMSPRTPGARENRRLSNIRHSSSRFDSSHFRLENHVPI